jgi:hypothetical protein
MILADGKPTQRMQRQKKDSGIWRNLAKGQLCMKLSKKDKRVILQGVADGMIEVEKMERHPIGETTARSLERIYKLFKRIGVRVGG